MSKTKPIIAYHFTGDKLRDGSPIPSIGHWLTYPGPIKMCQSGLHASRDPFDALRYAPGPMLHMVEVQDIIDEEKDKLVCRRRRIIRSGDATEMLRYFATICALSVIDQWTKCPADVVLDWLMTRDESLRSAAWSAAWSAAESARSAAESSARSARLAAWSAAESAAWSARLAAWSAAAWSARSAAESARSAAWSARSAAESARSAAWSARLAAESARSAAWSAQRKHFNHLVAEFFHDD